MNRKELDYLVNKKCSMCGGSKLVIETPEGFDVHEYLCRIHFALKYPASTKKLPDTNSIKI